MENEKSKEEQKRLVEGKWKEGEGGKALSFSLTCRRIWCVTAAAGLAQSGKYQVSSISGEGISRYKPPRTYEIRVEKGERKRPENLARQNWHAAKRATDFSSRTTSKLEKFKKINCLEKVHSSSGKLNIKFYNLKKIQFNATVVFAFS